MRTSLVTAGLAIKFLAANHTGWLGMLGLEFVQTNLSASSFLAFGQELQAAIHADLNGQRSLHVCSLCGSSIRSSFSSFDISKDFKSKQFRSCFWCVSFPHLEHSYNWQKVGSRLSD